jgi:uncharacterized protein YxjI
MSNAPAAWHPDPTGRHQLRYWDGAAWTEHVSDHGRQGTDPLPSASTSAAGAGADTFDRIDRALTVGDEGRADRVRDQVGRTGGWPTPGTGGGTIMTEPVLVVNQKAKLIELNNQYSVFDQHGTQVGAVHQVGQTTAKKLLRLVSNVDQFLTHRLEVVDRSGQVILRLTRPAKVFKSTVVVEGSDGVEIGRIVQRNMVGKIRFGLEVGGQEIGAIQAENWRAWDFRIEDASGAEVARITKTWEGLARAMFTTADNYVVRLRPDLPQPLRSLVVAAAVSVDTALKQDDRA